MGNEPVVFIPYHRWLRHKASSAVNHPGVGWDTFLGEKITAVKPPTGPSAAHGPRRHTVTSFMILSSPQRLHLLTLPNLWIRGPDAASAAVFCGAAGWQCR
eukprot:760575-Hanusia_phi.AAC.1